MKKIILVTITGFISSLHTMETKIVPQNAVERFCLIGALAQHEFEQLPPREQSSIIVEYPKSLTHYIATGEIMSMSEIDEQKDEDAYVKECEEIRPIFEEAATRNETNLPSISPEEYRLMARLALQEYNQRAKIGARSFKILKRVQQYLQEHQ